MKPLLSARALQLPLLCRGVEAPGRLLQEEAGRQPCKNGVEAAEGRLKGRFIILK